MKVRHNHTSIAALTNIHKFLLLHYIDSFSTLEPLQAGLEVPKHFGTSEYKAMGSFSPLLSDVLPLSPSEATWCLPPAQVPTQGCVPSAPTGALQTFSAGMQHGLHSLAEQGKTKVEKYPPQDKIFCGRSDGHRKFFWGKHLRLSHLIRHRPLPALQWIHTPACSRTGSQLLDFSSFRI